MIHPWKIFMTSSIGDRPVGQRPEVRGECGDQIPRAERLYVNLVVAAEQRDHAGRLAALDMAAHRIGHAPEPDPGKPARAVAHSAPGVARMASMERYTLRYAQAR
jgi:hypothetical protein